MFPRSRNRAGAKIQGAVRLQNDGGLSGDSKITAFGPEEE
jgi:hypothetical protein